MFYESRQGWKTAISSCRQVEIRRSMSVSSFLRGRPYSESFCIISIEVRPRRTQALLIILIKKDFKIIHLVGLQLGQENDEYQYKYVQNPNPCRLQTVPARETQFHQGKAAGGAALD
jgi:hypothetical protein